MKRRTILLALGMVMASSLSSGCWCYRPFAWRFGCQGNGCGGGAPLTALGEGPLLSAPVASHGAAPAFGGMPVGGGDPGCVGCGSGSISQGLPVGYPMAQGGMGIQPMPGGYAGMPTSGPIMTGPVTANPPFTGYPVLVSQGSQPNPGLGAPMPSKELPPPSMQPSGVRP